MKGGVPLLVRQLKLKEHFVALMHSTELWIRWLNYKSDITVWLTHMHAYTLPHIHTKSWRYWIQVKFQTHTVCPFLQVLYIPSLIFQRLHVSSCVNVCLTSRHQKQQGALLYHCSNSAASEQVVLFFFYTSLSISLSLSLSMSLTPACCLWELSVSVSVERWAVITSNAQAGIKTGGLRRTVLLLPTLLSSTHSLSLFLSLT